MVLLGAAVVVTTGAARAGRRTQTRAPGLVFESARAADINTDRLLAVTDAGNIRLTLSNSATFGTAFQARDTPSMEWPARSGIDHLVRAALWVGAISAATGDTLVTSGGRDAQYTDPIFQFSEFTPVAGRPQEYSRLRTSAFYRPGTVADENFHTVFVDTLPIVKDRSEERHTPMGIRVVQESYGWGFDPLDDFEIIEFNIINTARCAAGRLGGDLQRARHQRPAGQLARVAARRALVRFPGTALGQPQSHAHQPQRRTPVREPRDPFGDQGCRLRRSRTVRPRPRQPGDEAHLADGVDWSPTQFGTWSDDSLYARMATGVQANMDSLFEPNTDDNPVSVLSVGPFALLAPGDTTQVVFAFLAGEDRKPISRRTPSGCRRRTTMRMPCRRRPARRSSKCCRATTRSSCAGERNRKARSTRRRDCAISRATNSISRRTPPHRRTGSLT
jgi:hypothetical protein